MLLLEQCAPFLGVPPIVQSHVVTPYPKNPINCKISSVTCITTILS